MKSMTPKYRRTLCTYECRKASLGQTRAYKSASGPNINELSRSPKLRLCNTDPAQAECAKQARATMQNRAYYVMLFSNNFLCDFRQV